MKGAGWLGILMVGAGSLLIWAGFEGVSIVDVMRSVLNNEPLPKGSGTGTPKAAATPGSSGDTGFKKDGGGGIGAAPDAGAGSGGSNGGGGGW